MTNLSCVQKRQNGNMTIYEFFGLALLVGVTLGFRAAVLSVMDTVDDLFHLK